MKTISSVKWTDESIGHIARHAVSPDEIEELLFNEDTPPFVRSGRDNLHYVFGKTQAGRHLFVVVGFVRHGEVRIITARDMNAWEKNYFRRRGK